MKKIEKFTTKKHKDFSQSSTKEKNEKMKKFDHYILLAKLFEYPKTSLAKPAKELCQLLEKSYPELHQKGEDFYGSIVNSSAHEQQEYYLKTFDIKAIVALDLGYLIFGEDYKRAEFLVNLQKEHKNAGIDCGAELGDHLPNILELLAKSPDDDFREELGFIISRPVIQFMLAKFQEHDNYYKSILEILGFFLTADFAGEGLQEYAFAEERLKAENEFIMPSPKSEICQSNCKHKRF